METKSDRRSLKMKKIIWPFSNVLRFIFGILFLIAVVLDIIVIKTYLLALIMFISGCLFILRSFQYILLNNEKIMITSQLTFPIWKTQYKEIININQISKIEINKKNSYYSSRGPEPTSRGFDSMKSIHIFIELFLNDSQIKRIYANDLSQNQINIFLEYIVSKNKNVEIKKD